MSDELPTFDPGRLASLGGGDPAFEREMCAAFAEEADSLMAHLRDAVSRSDSAAARRHAHSLKGAAVNVGAPALGEACARLERLTGPDGDRHAVEEALHAAGRELERLRALLPRG